MGLSQKMVRKAQDSLHQAITEKETTVHETLMATPKSDFSKDDVSHGSMEYEHVRNRGADPHTGQ